MPFACVNLFFSVFPKYDGSVCFIQDARSEPELPRLQSDVTTVSYNAVDRFSCLMASIPGDRKSNTLRWAPIDCARLPPPPPPLFCCLNPFQLFHVPDLYTHWTFSVGHRFSSQLNENVNVSELDAWSQMCVC